MSQKLTLKAAFLILSLSFESFTWSQTPSPHPDTVPIYDVTVVSRTVNAVNYQYRSGPTPIDFRGTVLLPQSKGDAMVESKAGRTEIDAHFDHLRPSQQFGTEFLTYVLWAITPEGQARNLGEILASSSDKGHTRVTTDLQSFGLIVTAEPYSATRVPSDVVVLENQIRPETLGATEPIQARFELMPRGAYTYNVPAGPPPQGRKVSMSEYEETLELYQAQNAIQIADNQGAARYAADVFEKAQSKYDNAQQLKARHAEKSAVITAARDAAQTAEDARALTATRKHDAELASARSDAEHEQRLRLEAEAKAQNAQAQVAAAENALEAERNARREAQAEVAALSTTPTLQPVAPIDSQPPITARAATVVTTDPDEITTATRARLFGQLKGSLETLDTGRGLEVVLRDSDFHDMEVSPSCNASLQKVVGIVVSHPGLLVEVDGNSEAEGSAGERFSTDRANAVRQVLIRLGLTANQITARGLGNTRPFGSNATAQGRESNRRVEVIIHGDPIGTEPAWNKSYSLNLSR